MNKKIFNNFLYQAGYQLLLILMPIITIPVVSRALGPKGIGTYQYVYSIVNYFILIAGLGLQNYGVREIAIVRKDRKELSEKFCEIATFNAVFSIAILIIYLFIINFFNNTYFFFIESASVLSVLFDISWFFGGLEDFRKITVRNFIIKIASFILILLFVKDKSDLGIYFYIMSFSTLIGQMSLWISLKNYIDLKKIKLKKSFIHLKPALTFFVARVAFQFYYNVSLTLLGILSSIKEVGYFSNGVLLVSVAGSIVNALNTVMIPRMSNMYGENNEEGMIAILEKNIHLQIYFTIAIAFGIITINNQMITWFYGPKFSPLKEIIPLIAPILIFQTLQTSIASQYLIPKKDMSAYNQTVLIGAVLCTILNLCLIPLIGVYGAIVGYGFGYIVLFILRAKVLINSTSFKFDWRLIIGSTLAGTIMLLLTKLLTNKMSSNILTTILQCLIGAIIFLTVSSLIKINPLLNFNFFKKYTFKK